MQRGDVVAFMPPRRRGHEQKGRRYAVVVQADELQALSTVLVAPTSTSAPSGTFRPLVKVAGKQTTVLVDQLCAFDRTRFGRRTGRLAPAELEAVDEALELVLGLL